MVLSQCSFADFTSANDVRSSSIYNCILQVINNIFAVLVQIKKYAIFMQIYKSNLMDLLKTEKNLSKNKQYLHIISFCTNTTFNDNAVNVSLGNNLKLLYL